MTLCCNEYLCDNMLTKFDASMRFFLLLAVLFISNLSFGKKSTFKESAFAPNVLFISDNRLILSSSATYNYTVDTPEGDGLVSTGLKVEDLKTQLTSSNHTSYEYSVIDKNNVQKTSGLFETGDVIKINQNGKEIRMNVEVQKRALAPTLSIVNNRITKSSKQEIELHFTAGQRSPSTTIQLHIPKEIIVTLDNTTVDVIGRGEVLLRDLGNQSIGRTGTNYSYTNVGEVKIIKEKDGSSIIEFSNIDLRPHNGIDLVLKIKDVSIDKKGSYNFRSLYKTHLPEVYSSKISNQGSASLLVSNEISDFKKNNSTVLENNQNNFFTKNAVFTWTNPNKSKKTILEYSNDNGKTWKEYQILRPDQNSLTVSGLQSGKTHYFRLKVVGGGNAGISNIAYFNSGAFDATHFGIKGDGVTDDTDSINAAIEHLYQTGGGILYFSAGNYQMRTIYLKSNVWFYIEKGAVLSAMYDSDEPEATWFSDRAYRSGLSPTDPKPYSDPENYLTKQDVGHTFFRNTMFFAEREENIKIIGQGRITGNGKLSTSDRVMNSLPGRRADKMFTFKLCKNIEIGGFSTSDDMWYDPVKDEPFYISKSGDKNYSLDNVLHIDQAGHFVLLATGSDSISVHDTYFGFYSTSNARDIYDFMACNNVKVTNVYSKLSSDDIVKLGSDCSLGFTRPASNFLIRNIIGDTNCNLFQIGSETADDIKNVYVDNIYALGANKAGFSISTNDGGNVSNVYLNSGKTGKIHSRSVMKRTRAPFFISISNRGRVIGADVSLFSFKENEKVRNELLCTNVNIGEVNNIFINDIDISEVYSGSSFRGERWKIYDGSQNKSTPIIAGYKLPDNKDIISGAKFQLPNNIHTAFINKIHFNNVNLTVKGGNPESDNRITPPELGVGRYNVGDFGTQPAFGYWVRHVKDFQLNNCSITTEKQDGRFAVVLDDVTDGEINSVKVNDAILRNSDVKQVNSQNIRNK